jgi:hypothetical protein
MTTDTDMHTLCTLYTWVIRDGYVNFASTTATYKAWTWPLLRASSAIEARSTQLGLDLPGSQNTSGSIS